MRWCGLEGDGDERAAGDGVVEGPGAGGEPAGFADRDLHLAAESGCGPGGRFVELVAVGVAEDEQVDVADGAWAVLVVVAGRPGAEDEGIVDPGDGGEFGPDDDGRPEGLEEHVAEPGVVGTVGVGPDEAEVAEPATDHEAGLFGPVDLPVDGGIGEPETFSQRGHGVFEVGIAEHGREDLTLLA